MNTIRDSKVELTIMRNGDEQKVEVELGNLAICGCLPFLMPNAEPIKPETDKLGLALAPAPDGDGVLVLEVAPDSSADSKGLRSGDIVASVNGEQVESPSDVAEIVKKAEEDGRKSTLFQIKRDGNSSFVAIPFEKG